MSVMEILSAVSVIVNDMLSLDIAAFDRCSTDAFAERERVEYTIRLSMSYRV